MTNYLRQRQNQQIATKVFLKRVLRGVVLVPSVDRSETDVCDQNAKQYIWLWGIRIREPCYQIRKFWPRETLQIAAPNEVKGYGGRFHWPIHLSSPTGRGRLEVAIVKKNELGRLKVIKQNLGLGTRNSSVWYSSPCQALHCPPYPVHHEAVSAITPWTTVAAGTINYPKFYELLRLKTQCHLCPAKLFWPLNAI